MYALYFKNTGISIDNNGDEVTICWVTARSLDMTIPGGMLLLGEVEWAEEDGGLASAKFFRDLQNESFEEILQTFAAQLGLAREKALEDSVFDTNTLEYLKPHISYGYMHGRKAVFISAFREEEAAKAAFKEGFRWSESSHFSWPMLGKQ